MLNNSSAFAINAAAIGPLRCASRPSSPSNVSKMPKVFSLIWKAYHVIVSSSPSASGNAPFKKSATICSLPGLASTVANIHTLVMILVFRMKIN